MLCEFMLQVPSGRLPLLANHRLLVLSLPGLFGRLSACLASRLLSALVLLGPMLLIVGSELGVVADWALERVGEEHLRVSHRIHSCICIQLLERQTRCIMSEHLRAIPRQISHLVVVQLVEAGMVRIHTSDDVDIAQKETRLKHEVYRLELVILTFIAQVMRHHHASGRVVVARQGIRTSRVVEVIGCVLIVKTQLLLHLSLPLLSQAALLAMLLASTLSNWRVILVAR